MRKIPNSCRRCLYLFLHEFQGLGFLFHSGFFVGFFLSRSFCNSLEEELFSFPGMSMALRNIFMDASESAEQSGRKRTAAPAGTPKDSRPLKGSCNTDEF